MRGRSIVSEGVYTISSPYQRMLLVCIIGCVSRLYYVMLSPFRRPWLGLGQVSIMGWIGCIRRLYYVMLSPFRRPWYPTHPPPPTRRASGVWSESTRIARGWREVTQYHPKIRGQG